MSALFRIIRFLAILAGAGILLLILLLAFLSVKDYSPPGELPVKPLRNPGLRIDPGREVSLLLWNIGYAGLGRDMDFFYDGGSTVRAPLDHYNAYLNCIFNTVLRADTIDILLLQEVDSAATRSYLTNQVQLLTEGLPDFGYTFVLNYKVRLVPFPVFRPLGRVASGLLNISRFHVDEALRISAPGRFPWPKRLFFPDRCFSLLRYRLPSGKQLVVINLHNSAWEEGAELRSREMEKLQAVLSDEYRSGNFVIAGGDWNQPPPAYNERMLRTGDLAKKGVRPLEAAWIPAGWQWAWDPFRPTNRDVDHAYQKGVSPVTIYDYFLISPNISVLEVRTLHQGFACSDHQPVYLRVMLQGDTLLNPPVIPGTVRP